MADPQLPATIEVPHTQRRAAALDAAARPPSALAVITSLAQNATSPDSPCSGTWSRRPHKGELNLNPSILKPGERLVMIVGNYGSGKTEASVNIARSVMI